MFKQKSEPPASSVHVEPADAVQQARSRARQRLVGAVILLGIGIIGFPLVFETQPRPIPIDVPIEIPHRDSMPPLVMPAPRAAPAPVSNEPPPVPAATPAPTADAKAPPASSTVPARVAGDAAVITESRADGGRDVTPARPSASPVAGRVAASVLAVAPTLSASARASSTVAATSASGPMARAAASAGLAARTPASGGADDGSRALAILEARGTASAPSEATRFVVQVGAFADADSAREARKQVERLGLKTYTQVAQTAGGSRIRVRVGPFPTRGEADAALAKARAAGMTAVVLTL